jgi:hypothetical protein
MTRIASESLVALSGAFVLATALLAATLLATAAALMTPTPVGAQQGAARGQQSVRAAARRAARQAGEPFMFQTSDRCMACHNLLSTAAGEDISIGFDWRGSMMANAARDPYWQAGVRREVTDHPMASEAIQNECSKCHMPMMQYRAKLLGGQGEVFANAPANPTSEDARGSHLAADGVSCAVCHQITAEGLGTRESFVGGFVFDTTAAWGMRSVYGPFEVDAGRTRIMRSASYFVPRKPAHIQSSELCATCHTLITHTLNDQGEAIAEFPEQVPYLEWLASDFAAQAGAERSCQDCHMPVVKEPVKVSGVLGGKRDSVSRHVFRGGNFFMARVLNANRAELAVTALPHELEATASRTIQNLQTRTARLSMERAGIRGERLWAAVAIENLAGHKLPTAYPSRRVWLHFTVQDANGRVIFESGAFNPDGSIEGNDNDADPARYEPHFRAIERPDQVQIYETIITDPAGEITTGLLSGLNYAKDNRILPDGFDKATADEEVAVHGGAFEDESFVGGSDRLRYAVDVAGAEGPFQVEVELWYQPISYRWARNLADYDTFETNRMVRYYDAAAAASAVVIGRVSRTVEKPEE